MVDGAVIKMFCFRHEFFNKPGENRYEIKREIRERKILAKGSNAVAKERVLSSMIGTKFTRWFLLLAALEQRIDDGNQIHPNADSISVAMVGWHDDCVNTGIGKRNRTAIR